jgi:hypothetical protein
MSPRTDAAVRARRQATQEVLQRLQTALAGAARDHTPVTVAAVARTARVLRTFLYQNQQARALIEQATRTSRPQPGISNSRSRTQPAWRERALNAEEVLAQTLSSPSCSAWLLWVRAGVSQFRGWSSWWVGCSACGSERGSVCGVCRLIDRGAVSLGRYLRCRVVWPRVP